MFFKTFSAGVIGIDGFLVEVETDIAGGLPQYSLVGLPDSAVKESKERVRAAIRNSGFSFPLGRITINLAPAHLRKEGPAFDLSVAAGILSASGQWNAPDLDKTLLLGELSLEGTVKPVEGILPMALAAKDSGFQQLAVPEENAFEASLSGLPTYPLQQLKDIPSLSKRKPFKPSSKPSSTAHPYDFRDIIGQPHAKRALEIAAAGCHNVLFIGPPGTGKTMLASAIPSILPPLREDEWLDMIKIYSASGNALPLSSMNRPFRTPHHSITPSGLIGGGTPIKAGEITLAHNGVLFLDEISEFRRSMLELLRQPLEERRIHLHRHRHHVAFPAHFMLIASMNPCPCGYFGFSDSVHVCGCTPPVVERYQKRLSGPFLERLDLQIEVPRIDAEHYLSPSQPQEDSSSIRQRVLQAIDIQDQRYQHSTTKRNSDMTPAEVKKYCRLNRHAQSILTVAYEKFRMSHRSHHRVLKLARTIADLELREHISEIDIAQAIQYRTLEKNFF